MERNEPKPLDPMFTSYRGGQQVPAYQRRTGRLASGDNVLALRRSGQPIVLPPAVVQAQQPKKSDKAIRSGVHPAARHHRGHMLPKHRAALPSPTGSRIIAKHRYFTVPTKQTWLLYGMAAVVFAVGLVAGINGLRTNHQVAGQVKQAQKEADTATSDVAVPSTVKPTADAVQQYVVSPNLPRYIEIAKLSAHARVFSEGVNKRGQLQVPWNIYDVGWYNASAQPGQPGAMLMDGHSGVNNMHGIFYNLATLVSGDTVVITRGDGVKTTYSVVKVQTVDAKDVDMSSMLVSADTAKPGLNLITCAGDQIPGTTRLDKRVQVYAVQQ
jgi:LPXTG-site transpeptidase (sortase) family protein